MSSTNQKTTDMPNDTDTPENPQPPSSRSPSTLCSPLLIIKVKRWEYEITEADKFMDNGACVQLLTQSKQRGSWARKITSKLSKQAIKQISRFKRIPHEHPNAVGAQVFSLESSQDQARR